MSCMNVEAVASHINNVKLKGTIIREFCALKGAGVFT
jgi:hypothetical protein